MKILALFFVFATIAVAAHGFSFIAELDDIWEHFKEAFEKVFDGEDHEHSCRASFEKRVKENAMHNMKYDMGMTSYRRGLNKYSDVNHTHFVKHFLGFKSNPLGRANGVAWKKPLTALKLNSTVDWRNKGIVTPVKDQEQCGSCWTFSATGSLEGQLAKKTGKLVSLSEQNLVDCASAEGNYGCDGGFMDGAFMYVQKNKGIDTESSYPYTAMDGPKCLYKKANSGGNCSGYVDIPSGDENALKTAVATVGPVSVAIDAGQDSFQSYKSGIYDEPNCSNTTLDHGVLCVGYGTEDGKDYWLVKNSWGTTWGIQGYIKMSRNKNNQCGIATEASYPLV